MERSSIETILNRIKDYYKLKSDTDLAKFLDVPTSTLSNWKTRDTFPSTVIFTKCEEVDLNWLVFGSKSKAKSQQSTSAKSAKHPNNSGVEADGVKYFPLREKIEFPASAREMVESIKFYGGTIDWGSFTQEQQEKLQWKYEQTKLAIDKAYREYERVLEEKESEFSLYMIRIKLGEDLAAGDEPF